MKLKKMIKLKKPKKKIVNNRKCEQNYIIKSLKILNLIYFDSRFIKIISNININMAKILRLIDIKKYLINKLYKN